ncbi:MAG: ATP-dependent metallopeptidase FtsH/Yme1/Tma family protein [Planctomycetota bacterium]|nr:MAG: ATP-dependent metallopeptidase FtsH/Yme1/Tma family protein [Planctomycetota bacterium]REK28903.1 MAG: ATP-dependent metallopeptidase FtsH/Yme1/Tma family protein [Planctomycetota bacterium]REK39663.1 MAG: ATP-dependent metallopeptidase FtsH/Yme1/Tma family protein [Planctomycetota bacterium]
MADDHETLHSEAPDQSDGGERPVDRSGGARSPEDAPARSGPPTVWLLVLLGILLLFVWQYFKSPKNFGSTVDYSFFLDQLEAGNVKEVEIIAPDLIGRWKKVPENPKQAEDKEAPPLEERFNTVISTLEDRTLIDLLHEKDVSMSEENQSVGLMGQMLIYLFPLLIILAVFFFFMRRSADPFSSGMFGNFVRSPAKRFRPTENRTSFDDVAGMEHAKRELQEVVEFLKDPAKFQRLGAQIPKGVLLNGAPGTGKTLMARATAGEADVPFYSINGSEFIQMFVGVGASRVRDMFRTAKENAPSILFIDEIDAVGRVRGAGLGGGHDEREQTLNQILSEMDGFQQSEAVIVIAATNRPDVLDPALLRPGRFDRHVSVDLPTREGRLGILKVHSRKVPLADDVNLEEVAAGTIGLAGADLRNLVNEAALNATREGRDAVTREDFDVARDRVLMGAKREEVLSPHEKQMTAYHEAGHALLAWLLPDVDSVHKVTIIPRGRALGVTQLLPEEERYSIGEKRLHSELVVMLGGRAADKLVFDEYSAGAEDDLKRATGLARRMVGHWGMSEVIGPAAFRNSEDHPFLGKEIHESRQFSEETAHLIDQEIQRFLNAAHERATEILNTHRDKLDRIAQGLLENEMLGKDELTELIGPATERSYVTTSAENGNGQAGA